MQSNLALGMDHVGITVKNLEAATRFFQDAFGAEVIYDSVAPDDEPLEGEEPEHILHVAKGTTISAVRMLKLQYGPGLELFEMNAADQADPVRPSDYGLQHFAVYVDDIEEAIRLFEAAGGRMRRRADDALDHQMASRHPTAFASGFLPLSGIPP